MEKLLHKIDNHICENLDYSQGQSKIRTYPITIEETSLLYYVQHVVTLNILHVSPNLSSYLCFSSETLTDGFLQRNTSTDGQEAFNNPFCYPQAQLRASALADSLRLGTQSVGCPCLAELKSHMLTAIVADRCNTLCLVYPS